VSRSLSRLQALVLGAVVLAGSGLAVAGVFAVGSRGWFGKDALHVRVGFPEVHGVEVGTRVRIQGIDAGEVVRVSLPDLHDGPVILHLRLKGEFRHLVRTDSTVQIVSEGMIGGKVLEIHRGRRGGADGRPAPAPGPVADDALLASEPSTDLADAVEEVKKAVQGLSEGRGPIGREVLSTVKQTQGAVASFQQTMQSAQQVTDAAKTLPWFRNYVKDQQALLIRSNQECNPRAFAEADLFEPGDTTLTARGEQRLSDLVPWLTGLLPHKGAELVVLSYADPGVMPAARAQAVTDRQAEAVCQYLTGHHAVHKTGWFSSRTVKPLGLGLERPVVGVPANPPPAGVVVLVFVPRK
jgi:phospholipid/cholesterol/gamma-HCH transport system substrate-binding protein